VFGCLSTSQGLVGAASGTGTPYALRRSCWRRCAAGVSELGDSPTRLSTSIVPAMLLGLRCRS